MSDNEICEVACIIEQVRPKAVLVTDTVTKAWMPISQIENWDADEMAAGCEVVLDVPEWLAIEKGFA